MGIEVQGADGRRWIVTRRLRWPPWREVGDIEALDELLMRGDFSLVGILFGFVAFLVVGVVVVLVLPLIVFVAEVVLVLAAVAVLRGKWIVEASTEGPPAVTKAWEVRGWTRSKRAVEEIANELRAGVDAAPAAREPA